MEFGVYTFVETERDPQTGRPVHVERTFAEMMEEIELADRVGLDVFGARRASSAGLRRLRAGRGARGRRGAHQDASASPAR